jgi:diketogulonate reductase-like aldo/keto reductase
VTLANGVKMPWVGLGTFDQGAAAVKAVQFAIKAGYRSIDTGSYYQNEEEIGAGIRASDAPRRSLFITTKVWNSEHGFEATLKSFEVSLGKLGLDFIDLYLVHWPVGGHNAETWKALEKIYEQGKVHAIGVSNFEIHHLEELRKVAAVWPMVNQIELHPLKTSVALRKYCADHEIQVEAWAPLAQGNLSQKPVLKKIADAHKKTIAQVILRWHLQQDIVAIPKSSHEGRIKENIDIFDFELSDSELGKIDALDEDRHLLGFDTDTFPPELSLPPVSPWPYALS